MWYEIKCPWQPTFYLSQLNAVRTETLTNSSACAYQDCVTKTMTPSPSPWVGAFSHGSAEQLMLVLATRAVEMQANGQSFRRKSAWPRRVFYFASPVVADLEH